MQDTSAPAASPPVTLTNTTPRAHTIRLIILGVIGLIVVAALAYFWKDITTAVALRDVRIAEAQYRDIQIKQFSVFGLKTHALKTESAVGDYAYAAGTKVAIVGTSEGSQDVVVLSEDSRALTTDGLRKAALSISADGTKVAYAVLTDPRPDATFDINMARWTVRITDVATGATQDLGQGFSPEFFVRDGVSYVFFTTPTQVVFYDMEKNVSTGLNFFTLGGVDYAGHISADGTHLAIRSGVTGMYDVFSVDSVSGAIALSPMGSLGIQLSDAQWSGDVLYGITDTTPTVVSVTPADLAHPKTLGVIEGSGYYRFIR